MKIHLIVSENGAQFVSRCGSEFFDPDRECGTRDQQKATCEVCKSPDISSKSGKRGFSIKHPCPNCGRMMSRASMVKHNRAENEHHR